MAVRLVDTKDYLMAERWEKSMADKWVDVMAGW